MPSRQATHHPARKGVTALALAPLLWLFLCLTGVARADERGLPFTRSYSWEEIGVAPKNARISFDRFGRLCLVDIGIYVVLNDTRWENIIERSGAGNIGIATIVAAPDGREYFGGRGYWGLMALGENSRMRPMSMVPADPPAWISPAYFDNLIPTAEGLYFGSWEGFVYYDYASRQTQLFELPNTSVLFNVGQKVFVASRDRPVLQINPRTHTLNPLKGDTPGTAVIEKAAPLNETTTLVYRSDGQLMQCDGTEVKPWVNPDTPELAGPVSAMQSLRDGGAAIAVSGKGLFLLTPKGSLHLALTTPQFHRISNLATNEPGVLWMTTDSGVSKVLYGDPLSTIGMELGLPVSWPCLAKWKDTTIIASGGKLYECLNGRKGFPGTFRLLKEQLREGVASMLTMHNQILACNKTGVYALGAEGVFQRVCDITDVNKLIAVGTTCFAIGRTNIAALQWNGTRWLEAAPRVPGLSFSPIVHASNHAAWAEMGPNGAARIALEAGVIHVESPPLPWTNEPWTNIGIVGDIIVFCVSTDRYAFYNDLTKQRCDAPMIEKAMREVPYWTLRLAQDSKGRLWGTNEFGVTLITPRDDGYDIDATSLDLLNERYPMVHILPGDDVWLSSDRVLHHVESDMVSGPRTPSKPVLTSVVESTESRELLPGFISGSAPVLLPYRHNNLSFTFFSGSYAWKRPPSFEMRTAPGDPWMPLPIGSSLNFHNLPEGRHRLEIRTAEGLIMPSYAFSITAPWYRTWPAYALYALGVLSAALAVAQTSSRLARRRTRILEKLVNERTSQLESTMLKLNDETRYAATLAERNRLAGEIHDSVQQGLSGAMLQLEAMLDMQAVQGEVRSRLNVVRNMVSFSRHEVQHAVWDLESPLLENADLGEALRKLADLINTGAGAILVDVQGDCRQLSQEFNHNLLRIAQEATTNAVKHARADTIRVRLEYGPGQLVLQISDNGVGFDPDETEDTKLGHFGLGGMKSRARKIGATFSLESNSKSGTKITICAPLPSQEPVI